MNNQDIDIKNLQFISEDRGSFFSKTCREYRWKFVLDGIQRIISLYHSKIIGRRTIYLGNQQIWRHSKYTYNFQHSFQIEAHNISIIQNGYTYMLKIDGVPFNRLLNEQKLRRFNILKETFLEKEKEKMDKIKKNREIRRFRTFNRGSAGIPISRRNEVQSNIYKTNIYTSFRGLEKINNENENENENDIKTSSKNNDINNINNEPDIEPKEINLNQGQYYYYDEESSDDLSNRANDGGDSNKDEDEEEDNDDKTIQESFRPPEDDGIFNSGNQLDENDNEQNEIDEDDENNINNENNIDNKNNDENEDIKEEDKNNKKTSYNNINNEPLPINQNKIEENFKKIKIESKNNKNDINNNIFNINNDDNNNINKDNNNNINNDNNINNKNNIDLLGEEIYNSLRDKDYNNFDNNLNINYLISQQQKYSDYKSNNPSNPFEGDSINTN